MHRRLLWPQCAWSHRASGHKFVGVLRGHKIKQCIRVHFLRYDSADLTIQFNSVHLFELCRLPQRPSLKLHPLGGSTLRLWPLFHLRAKGKWKEMTGTQHVVTLKHQFLQHITIKNVFVLFHYQNNFERNYSSSIWWRHLPAACNNFFEAGVSGN
jgi:hypothetical protein